MSNLGIVSVRDAPFGAKGDGSTDDTTAIQAALNYCFGTQASPHGVTGAATNRPLYFPAGNYRLTDTLILTKLVGGHIFGAGRYATTITQTGASKAIFLTNGCSFSKFEKLRFVGAGGATIFDLDFDNTSGGIALQSNTFADILFDQGGIGLNIGKGGWMGSETLISNCFFSGLTVCGMKTNNSNALQQTVIGGNFQSCGYGIWVSFGSVPVIHGVGFQNGAGWDLVVDNGTWDVYSISGCRSESDNFVHSGNSVALHISGCGQTSATAGFFTRLASPFLQISSCSSRNGNVRLTGRPQASIRSSQFGRLDWIDTTGLTAATEYNIEIESVRYAGTIEGIGDAAADQFIRRQRISTAGTQNYTVA